MRTKTALFLPVWYSQGEIHPSILALGRKYTSGEVTGATARAVAMLMAFKQVVMDYYTPPDKVFFGRSRVLGVVALLFTSLTEVLRAGAAAAHAENQKSGIYSHI